MKIKNKIGAITGGGLGALYGWQVLGYMPEFLEKYSGIPINPDTYDIVKILAPLGMAMAGVVWGALTQEGIKYVSRRLRRDEKNITM